MSEVCCEKCGATNGSPIYCSGLGCGRDECGEPTHFFCKDCDYHTAFYHITTLGEAVLKELFLPKDSEFTTNSEEIKDE